MQERIPDELTLPELTLRGLILGALITVVFTASNVYLGLKVGLTFASSIPAAVISMAVLRYFSGANILENNMVQTQASAAGTLSSIIFILPGLLMIGYWSGFPFWQTAAICSIGGILGVLYTIPLRRVMVVQSELPYPEGVAAAEILRVGSDGAEDEEDARAPRAAGNAPGLYDILGGGLVAALFSLWSSGFKVLAEGFSVWLSAGQAAFRLSTGFSLALVGAGYLMGITAGIAILIGVGDLLGRRGAVADRQQRAGRRPEPVGPSHPTVEFAGALPRRRHHRRGRAVDPGDPVQADGAGRLGLPRGSARQ